MRWQPENLHGQFQDIFYILQMRHVVSKGAIKKMKSGLPPASYSRRRNSPLSKVTIVAFLSRPICLRLFTAEHPWREHATGQLMLALHRSGRRADALAVYSTFRSAWACELGLDPGHDLQMLHEQILAAGPALASP